MRSIWLLLALFALAACAPDRRGRDDDDATADDDDATADDDDATADDDDTPIDDDDTPIDDDDTPPDDDDTAPDDDDDDQCGDQVDRSIWFDASPGDFSGLALEGELNWDGTNLSVSPDFGPAFALPIYGTNVDLDTLFGDVAGPGAVFVIATSWGAWTANGVLAIHSYSGSYLTIGVNSPGAPEQMDNDWFWVSAQPRVDECTVPLFDVDGCGEGAALPLDFEIIDASGPFWSGSTWPGELVAPGPWTFEQYQGWQIFENWCDDFDSPGYSWAFKYYEEMDG